MKDKFSKYIIPCVIAILVVVVGFWIIQNRAEKKSLSENLPQSVITEEAENTGKVETKTTEAQYIAKIEKSITEKDYTAGKSTAEIALKSYPRSGKILSHYIGLLAVLGETPKAIEYSDTLIALDSSNYVSWKLKAQLVRSTVKEHTTESKSTVSKIYEDALKATGNNIEIISAYAVFAEDYLTKAKAIELWRLAQKVNPVGSASYQMIIDRLSK